MAGFFNYYKYFNSKILSNVNSNTCSKTVEVKLLKWTVTYVIFVLQQPAFGLIESLLNMLIICI